jgi:hypothetical protein
MSRRNLASVTVIGGLCAVFAATVLITGCGKKEAADLGGDTGMPRRHKVHHYANRGPVPGAPVAPGAPAKAPKPKKQAAKPKIDFTKPIAIASVPLKSPIQHVTIKSGGVAIDYLKFRYKNHDGAVRLCEIPASETKESRLVDEWISTFDIYQQEPPAPKVAKKKPAPERVDYPFVSPPPRGGGGQ